MAGAQKGTSGGDRHLERIAELDTQLRKAAKPIKVLNRLEWPESVGERFLADYRAGRPRLPKVTLQPRSHTAEIEVLESLMGRCDRSHPLGNFLYKTAWSYLTAARMIEGIGTEEFTRQSVALYGRPAVVYRRQNLTLLDAAEEFLRITDELLGSFRIPPAVPRVPSTDFAESMRKEIRRLFQNDEVAVELDPLLTSKATAGSRRVRVRDGILFTDLDLGQLVHHEAFVHAATMFNGKKQPGLASLGLGAPRTTRTQEGIATLAELATLSMDINRLRRLALRVRAVKAALDGADFLQTFQGFLQAGQTEEDSYQSTQRIFRGGDVRGKIVFTKDAAYLGGLLEVHTFLRVAVQENRPELIPRLFAGRLTLGDVFELSPFFESGFLVPATFIPPWAGDLRRIAAMLAYSGFIARIKLEGLALRNFLDLEEERIG
jgi:uncharacterized protein (TIGR02421 family)